MLKADAAIDQAKILHQIRLSERNELDRVRRYWKGRQKLPAVISSASPSEVKVMARSSRVNIMPIVVNSLVQSMFVDGFRSGDEERDQKIWDVFQQNRMDRRQTGIHRATAGFGTGYATVLPGDPVPVIRGYSPRQLTAMYGEDDDWPIWALTYEGNKLWRLFDDQAIYFLKGDGQGEWEFIESREHGLGVTPVIRYVDEDDLDREDEPPSEALTIGSSDEFTGGQVAPLMDLQDQIDLTTFGLQIAQHFGAFRQRYVIGWVADNEAEQLKASAASLWAIDEEPDEVKIGEFSQTDLKGYIESREKSLRHAATLSQTPIHELTGDLVQLSAEALAAAEAGKDRKVDERCTNSGESHEQVAWAVGQYIGEDVPPDAQVIWRDTSARAFAATVDGLGKLSQMLGVPPQELWERIPGVTKQDADRWRQTAEQGNAFDQLADMLDRQAGDVLA